MQFTYVLWGIENTNFYYLPILKNAQTWGKCFFEKNFNFRYLEDKPVTINKDEKNVIVFYRNPLSRWFSGAAQWFMKYGTPMPIDYKIDNLMMKLIFSAGKLDAHTKLQRDAFAGLPYENCIFFDVENYKFQNNLTHYLENVQKAKVAHNDLPKINVLQESQLKINIHKQLKTAYESNLEFQKQLYEHLYFDIEVYTMIKNKNLFYSCE